MGKIAFVFAGQGAQKPGMGKEIAEISKTAAEVLKRADEVRPGTVAQCFEAPQEELSMTKNTQPCVYTVDFEMAAVLAEKGIRADMVAGYSLGELAALAYSGVLTFEEGLRLVEKRGKLMQQASEEYDTGMVAVLKLANEKVEQLCEKYDSVFPVNFNCAGQVSVAGDKKQLQGFIADAKEAGGLVRILEVSGGFHSPFMKKAAEGFAEVLKESHIDEPVIPVYSNRTSGPYGGTEEETRQLLVEQISNPIRWQKLIENMIDMGVDTFVEVGPGTALTKMIRRISKDITMLHVDDGESLAETVERIKNNE
ncbi:MAG: ACP S-malonyltransferase [Bacillota bacterium]|nr:ACP S-malonyltransferase [Bacillota bacterium]